MVIAGVVNRAAFYCRVNHRDRDYEKYLDDVMRRLEEKYGKQKWDLQIFFEEASGADPNRKEFNRLKAEIAANKIDTVVTMKTFTLARDWGQFMVVCREKNVKVVCNDKIEDEFIGVFAEQGISGYCENSPQFQRMMEKARAGEIDLIITKSISRFARNTVTVLKFARKLKELGVGIFLKNRTLTLYQGTVR